VSRASCTIILPCRNNIVHFLCRLKMKFAHELCWQTTKLCQSHKIVLISLQAKFNMSSSQSKIIKFGWDFTKLYQFNIKQMEIYSFLGPPCTTHDLINKWISAYKIQQCCLPVSQDRPWSCTWCSPGRRLPSCCQTSTFSYTWDTWIHQSSALFPDTVSDLLRVVLPSQESH